MCLEQWKSATRVHSIKIFGIYMSFRPYFINVSGSIIAIEGKNYTQSWVAGACRDEVSISHNSGVYDIDLHAITGDLILNKQKRAVPYAMYVASGSVGIDDEACPGTDLVCSPGFYPAFAYFKEYITEIHAALKCPVRDEIKDLYYNGLYISAFSILELFLCDFLLCGVFSCEKYYERAMAVLKITDSVDQSEVEKTIKDKVYNTVFHRFDDIKTLFTRTFDFGFPDYQELKKRIYRRHNIVHRFSLSNWDRMTVCEASHDDVASLIETIILFVEEMKDVCGLSPGERECLN